MSSNGANHVLYHAAYISPAILMVVSLFNTLLLIYIILFRDLKVRNIAWSLTSIFSPINTLMILHCVGFIGFSATEAIYNHSSQRNTIIGVFNGCFLAVVQVTYVYVSWFRSSDIIKQESSETLLKIFKIALYICPFISIVPPFALLGIGAPVLLGNMPALTIFSITLGLNGTLFISIDQYFLLIFIKYNRYLQSQMGMGVGRRLEIITKFGAAATLCALCALQLFGVTAICMLFNPVLDKGWVLTVYYIAWILKDWLLAAVGWVLVVMKWKIVELKKDGLDVVKGGTGTGTSRKQSIMVVNVEQITRRDTLLHVPTRKNSAIEVNGTLATSTHHQHTTF
ncbi:hypothetical protein BDR26DRAFT_871577 [Obelidium mucronatum]|nr:hypothetical protein BDR26DRAFT_871577 [Obelidium mucronatum]